MSGTVPFLDLAQQHAEIRPALDAAFARTVQRGSFVGGADVDAFEAAWAHYCERAHAVGVGNGTDALELAFAALGIGPGDEVVVPANTFVATAAAVVAVGATPVFVDVDPDTLLLTAPHLEAALTPRTAAVAAVHLYGQPADMEPIAAVANRAGIAVVEDAAQAHGARCRGRRVGSFGHVATFSFYPGKNLGALGDGGAVVTDDAQLAERIRSLADHGRSGEKYRHVRAGRNSRLDGMQAAFLLAKLERLDEWNEARRNAHRAYGRRLAGTGIQQVEIAPGMESVHHLEVVRVANRDEVRAALDDAGIGHGLHYPIPCHRQPAFGAGGDWLPVVDRAATEILSLPMFPHLTDEQIDRVCAVVSAAGRALEPTPVPR